MAHVSHKEKASFAAKLKTIWLQPTKKRAYQTARMLIDEYEKRFPGAMRVLDEGVEDALQFMTFSCFDRRKISSTNIIERLHREIRRRSRVVGIFPGMDRYLRLVSAYLIEYGEDWSTGRCYVRPALIEEQRTALRKAA
jgi:transposase-like protein